MNNVKEVIADVNSEENDTQKSPQNQNILTSSIVETSASQNENESRLNTNSPSNTKLNINNSALSTESETGIASNKEKGANENIQNIEDAPLFDKNKLRC